MFKIELYDRNCCPICDGTTSFFTDDLEDFQKRWTKLETDSNTIKRFLESKNGKIITDYWSDDPELNIVQEDKNPTIYQEQAVLLNNRDFESYNAYDFPTLYHVDTIKINFKWIRFKNKFYRIAKFKVNGCSEEDLFKKGWNSVHCYGNPVIENNEVNTAFHQDKFSYKENTLETICYIMNFKFRNEKELIKDYKTFTVTDEVLDYLFKDIAGEAG